MISKWFGYPRMNSPVGTPSPVMPAIDGCAMPS